MNSPKIRRRTPQRAVIMEELCSLKTHPTAAELFTLVRRRLPRISLGTVYRNLEVLHGEGLILKMGFAGAETRYDGNTQAHDHIRCLRCGILRDLPATAAVPLPEADLGGFAVLGHRLEHFGVCPACRSLDGEPLEAGPQAGSGAAH